MAKVVTLGELMLRLSPPGYDRLMQASSFTVYYGGAEANVAASLSQYGDEAVFLSKLPDNPMGNAALAALKGLDVDCSYVVRGGERLGIYFAEKGISVRPASVLYDRKGSAFTEASCEEFDFDEIFEDADLFHVSGITPILGGKASELTFSALRKAKDLGLTVSFDMNYRAGLWREGIKEKQELLSQMMPFVDICFGNVLDAVRCLGYSQTDIDFRNNGYEICVEENQMRNVLMQYGFRCLITSLRQSASASDNTYSGIVCTESGYYHGKTYSLHIADRLGGGDAFAAGCLHGIMKGMGYEKALEFGLAASAVKHTVNGDLNYAGEAEIYALMNGGGGGQVRR